MKGEGRIGFRASRNLLGEPYARTTTLWQGIADWARFADGDTWGALRRAPRQVRHQHQRGGLEAIAHRP
jgi:hypothetical protein